MDDVKTGREKGFDRRRLGIATMIVATVARFNKEDGLRFSAELQRSLVQAQ